jgi:glutamate-1-semialdehyde 2,1-aminomutase
VLSIPVSERHYGRACEHLAMGVSSGLRRAVTPTPMYFDRADGPHFYDVDGHRYVDHTLAWGPLILGSNHADLNAAVASQLARGYTFGAQHADEIRLAELMCDRIPGVDQVIFSNTGSEAVQAALRLARGYTGRDKIIKFEGHYHGWMNNVLVSYRPKPDQLGRTAATCGGQPAGEFADTITLPWNDLAALERAFAEHPGAIAAVITEPILVNSGSLMPDDGYLAALVALCAQHGAVSIFDEVITGFRIALGGAREHFGVRPDLSVYAKAMAGGFSLAAVGGSRHVFDALRDGRTIHAGTYNGNCVALAAGIATIEALGAPGVFDRMHDYGRRVRAEIERCARDAGMSVVTTGLGSVFSVHFGLTEPPRRYTDFAKADVSTYTAFRMAMLEQGVLLLPEGRWYVGAAHDAAALEHTLAAVRKSIGHVAGVSA